MLTLMNNLEYSSRRGQENNLKDAAEDKFNINNGRIRKSDQQCCFFAAVQIRI